MLQDAVHCELALELQKAEATCVQVEHFSKRFLEMTLDDNYTIQHE